MFGVTKYLSLRIVHLTNNEMVKKIKFGKINYGVLNLLLNYFSSLPTREKGSFDMPIFFVGSFSAPVSYIPYTDVLGQKIITIYEKRTYTNGYANGDSF